MSSEPEQPSAPPEFLPEPAPGVPALQVDDALIVDQVRASEPAGEAETFVERSHDTR